MHYDPLLEDVLLFDVPAQADRLYDYLQGNRLVWMHARDGVYLVAATLRPEEGDLAAVLRSVEAWAIRTGVEDVPFELDGCRYVLRPAAAIAAAA